MTYPNSLKLQYVESEGEKMVQCDKIGTLPPENAAALESRDACFRFPPFHHLAQAGWQRRVLL